MIVARDAGPAGADVVVVVHGFTGDASTMSGIADALVEAGRRVLSVDLVGHGSADSPSDLSAYSMAACIEQLRTLFADLGVERVDVVGYSMGARVALSLACADAQLVRSLVLIGGTPGIADAAERSERVAQDEALADRIETEPLQRFVDEWMAKPIFATQATLPSDQISAARQQRLANKPAGLANSLRGMGTGAMPPLHEALGSMPVRTLVLAGRLDAKFIAIGRALADQLPQGRFHEIANAGHATHLEQPEKTTAAIIDFLVR